MFRSPFVQGNYLISRPECVNSLKIAAVEMSGKIRDSI